MLTPFVVTKGTVFPFVVGKALWSRAVIEIVFMLWAALALLSPAFRPPRSLLLNLLAAGLVVSLLAAVFGVSVQRSMWSSYERMQGVVDLVHWFALVVVIVSVLRTGANGGHCSGSISPPARASPSSSSPGTTKSTCPSSGTFPSASRTA